VRDAWSRLGKPQTYAQAWLSAVILSVMLGAFFAAIAVITNWQPPWGQFAVLLPAWSVVLIGLSSSYDIRRRRRSGRGG
jgi:hypothetical protein